MFCVSTIKPDERLAVTLLYLATGETFHSLECSFRISQQSISTIVLETSQNLGFQHVQPPQPARPAMFTSSSNLPKVIRALTHHLFRVFGSGNRPITSVGKHSKLLQKVDLGSTLRNMLPQLMLCYAADVCYHICGRNRSLFHIKTSRISASRYSTQRNPLLREDYDSLSFFIGSVHRVKILKDEINI